MTWTITVDHENVDAAKALIEIMGGPEKVDPLIVKIANAKATRIDGACSPFLT